MRDVLHPLLAALTLLDLAFVQATGVVEPWTLAPLWALAAASHRLRRLQHHAVYRGAWNVGVVLVFALLVHHATTTGLLHMLEDGLLLAVLCQVHLLNNVGERQRADLVFFNSLLVTFVTGFFAPDLSWSVLFALHAFAMVAALQVHVHVRAGADLTWATTVGLVRDAGRRTLVLGAATAVAFVACPRDFTRKGWLGDRFALGDAAEAGIGESIRLGDDTPPRLGAAVVMTVEPVDGRLDSVPERWRVRTYTGFDGTSWSQQDARQLGSRFATDPQFEGRPDGVWQRARPVAGTGLVVRLFDAGAGRLPLPLTAAELRPGDPGLLLDPRSHGGIGVLRSDSAPSPITYEVRLAQAPLRVPPSARVRRQMLELPTAGVPGFASSLATQLRAALPPDASPVEVAGAAVEWLQTQRRYQLPGTPGFAGNLGEFLLGTGAGHCEYFATALAVLLRLQGVPCRLVGGWLVHEADSARPIRLVRGRDAHAWVEAWLPDGSWLELDATPPAVVAEAGAPAEGLWQRLGGGFEAAWNVVVGFDERRRAEWFAAVGALPGHLLRVMATSPVGAGLVLGGVVLLVLLVRSRRRIEPTAAAVAHAAHRLRLPRRPGETPRELLQRAQALPAAPHLLRALSAAVERHERVRYAAAPLPSPPRLSSQAGAAIGR